MQTSAAASWIRYKLDRSFDHLLIDEAQDTNAAQWDIVFALIDDFFSGEGARGDRLRTIFTVGDYKQAIFGFQGTSPRNFERAKQKVKQRIDEMRQHAHELRENRKLPGWADLDLGQSFRTSKPVLDFIDQAIDAIGPASLGLAKGVEPHEGVDRAGLVTAWEPVSPSPDEAAGAEEDESQERDWLPPHEELLASKIAEQVRRWVTDEEPFVLEKDHVEKQGPRRHARAGDIMVLVRKRKDLAAQIVGKLHGAGVAVAGIDRLRLGSPLAVMDLVGALRFAAQPHDDLQLANVLSSPLVGWSQDDLLKHVPRASDVRLWHHLRSSDDAFVVRTVDTLRELLDRADFATPQALLAWMLNGPWNGRRSLVARLGSEANDPIDELINAAFAYERAHVPSLAGFIEWFDAGSGEVKRDPDSAADQVRVMTVHAAKGLQAPIVILADAAGDPGSKGELDLADDPVGIDEEARRVPLPPITKDQLIGPVGTAGEQADAAAMEEHWRLLYVAMTRAEEALFITGSLGKKQAKKGEPHEDSWYARLAPVFDGPELEDPIWTTRREFGTRADPLVEADATVSRSAAIALPDWLLRPVGPEPRPPRPLAPSDAGVDRSADPPLAAEAAALAARRGTLIHKLLERLPELDPGARAGAGEAWLAGQASDLDADVRAEMLASAMGVLDDPQFADVFSSQALAEVPLAANVDGVVVAGTADRLLVTGDKVTVIDFKTTRRPPGDIAAIPVASVRQMAAYAAALEAIYPGRTVRAAILYTQTPVLFELPPETLAPHKGRLDETQQSFGSAGVE